MFNRFLILAVAATGAFAQTPPPAQPAVSQPPSAQSPGAQAPAAAKTPPAAPAASETAAAAETRPERGSSFFSRFSIGFRARGFPRVTFKDRTEEVTNAAKTCNPCKYTTTPKADRAGIGPTLEIRLWRQVFLVADYLHQGIGYEQTSELTDASSKTTTITETTHASYWDLPVRLQVGGLPRLPRIFYITAGVAQRRVTHIRTRRSFVYPDGDSANDEVRAIPSKTKLNGLVAGAGFRAVDDFRIKVMPEVRYTKWSGYTFDSFTTRSNRSQLEVMLGFAF